MVPCFELVAERSILRSREVFSRIDCNGHVMRNSSVRAAQREQSVTREMDKSENGKPSGLGKTAAHGKHMDEKRSRDVHWKKEEEDLLETKGHPFPQRPKDRVCDFTGIGMNVCLYTGYDRELTINRHDRGSSHGTARFICLAGVSRC